MSIKTLAKDPGVEWVAMTFENEEIYLTQREYEAYQHATNTGIKTLHFRDGSLAVNDIRMVEKIDKILPKPKVVFTDRGFDWEADE